MCRKWQEMSLFSAPSMPTVFAPKLSPVLRLLLPNSDCPARQFRGVVSPCEASLPSCRVVNCAWRLVSAFSAPSRHLECVSQGERRRQSQILRCCANDYRLSRRSGRRRYHRQRRANPHAMAVAAENESQNETSKVRRDLDARPSPDLYAYPAQPSLPSSRWDD